MLNYLFSRFRSFRPQSSGSLQTSFQETAWHHEATYIIMNIFSPITISVPSGTSELYFGTCKVFLREKEQHISKLIPICGQHLIFYVSLIHNLLFPKGIGMRKVIHTPMCKKGRITLRVQKTGTIDVGIAGELIPKENPGRKAIGVRDDCSSKSHQNRRSA